MCITVEIPNIYEVCIIGYDVILQNDPKWLFPSLNLDSVIELGREFNSIISHYYILKDDDFFRF